MVALSLRKKLTYTVGIAGIILAVALSLATPHRAEALSAAYEGYWWSPNHGNSVANGSTYNFISDNVYMQHAVSYDGYTDILDTTLKVYSTSPYIQVEVFGADLCTNQPSYTTDEFYTSSRSGMRVTYSLGRATDEVGRIGVITTAASVSSTSATGTYKGSSCTASNAIRVLTARSNIYDQTMGRYVYNFVAKASTAQKGFINGFRVRALAKVGGGTTASGIIISADPGQTADHFGLEVGYPRGDNGNPGGSSTYADYAVPFVPDCEMTSTTTKYISIFDDDQDNASVQSNTKFRVKVQSTNGSDTDVAFSNITGESSSSRSADGYYTITGTNGGSKSTVRAYFPMDPNQSYVFRVDNLYNNNTLQISLPSTTSPVKRNCPKPASLGFAKIDDTIGATAYGGNYGPSYPFNGLNVKVASSSSTANPYVLNNAVKVTNLNGTYATISLTSAIPAGWVLKGHSICDTANASCTSAYLTNPSNIVSPGAKSFSHKFLSGKTYSMRWIFSRVVATTCVQPPTFMPESPDPYTAFDLTPAVRFTNSSYNPTTPRIALTIRNSANAIVYPTSTQAATKSGDTASRTYPNITLNTAGRYTATWVYTDTTPTNLTCTYSFYIGNKPFFHVLGGDMYSGGGGDVSGIQSWNYDDQPTGTYWVGAGTEFAALSSGEIRNFSTGRDSYLGGFIPESLAFSNEAAAIDRTQGLYGGSLAEIPPRQNYFEQLSDTATLASGTSINVGSLASGTYIYPNNIAIYGTVPAGRQVTILSTGDVVIGTNGGTSTNLAYGAYTSLNTIPRLNVFTESGDIKVASGVREMHGFFSTGPGGTFYSCAIESGSTATPVEYDLVGTYFAQCNSQLKIYGSVQADTLVLSRTFDTLKRPFSLPAEVFVYSPEVWMARSTNSSTSGAVNFKSYINLPPVL